MLFDQLKRRDFIMLLGGAAVAWPPAAQAQQGAMPVIGFLAGPSAGASKSTLSGFRLGLRQAGYVEGQNAHIAFRWAEGRYDRFPELAAELVSLPVAVIAAIGSSAALAAITATKTIPIVFASSVDPVKIGLVASFNRPGGNATGVAFLLSELVGKHFELLRELLPKAAVLGLLVNPTSQNAETQLAAVPGAMGALGLQIVVQNASTDPDLETAFANTIDCQRSPPTWSRAELPSLSLPAPPHRSQPSPPRRQTPLMRVKDGDSYVLVGSEGGAPKDPVWVHNLRSADRASRRDRRASDAGARGQG
jgi:ABC-type uncharacterized transport system substrate-binding protein